MSVVDPSMNCIPFWSDDIALVPRYYAINVLLRVRLKARQAVLTEGSLLLRTERPSSSWSVETRHRPDDLISLFPLPLWRGDDLPWTASADASDT